MHSSVKIIEVIKEWNKVSSTQKDSAIVCTLLYQLVKPDGMGFWFVCLGCFVCLFLGEGGVSGGSVLFFGDFAHKINQNILMATERCVLIKTTIIIYLKKKKKNPQYFYCT